MKVSMFVFTILSVLAMSNIAFAQYCNPGFQNSYQCSGNWQQQLYINPDCSQYWSSIQYCNSGCTNGFCQGTVSPYPSGCSVSASMTTPSNINSGDLATSTITLTNTGGTSATINVNGYICHSDGSSCFNIPCSANSVFVPANSVAYDVCTARNYYGYSTGTYGINSVNYPYNSYPYTNNPYNYPNNNYPNNNYPYNNYPNYNYPSYYPGTFRIRADFSGCNMQTSMYSGVFTIQPYQYCTPGNTNNYQCSGNVRQVQYQNGDCTTQWTNVETCPNGCSNGVCLTATPTSTVVSTSVSTVTSTTTVSPSRKLALPDLATVILILALIVLLIIFFRLVTDREDGHKYHREDEYWRIWRSDVSKFFSRFGSGKSEVC